MQHQIEYSNLIECQRKIDKENKDNYLTQRKMISHRESKGNLSIERVF